MVPWVFSLAVMIYPMLDVSGIFKLTFPDFWVGMASIGMWFKMYTGDWWKPSRNKKKLQHSGSGGLSSGRLAFGGPIRESTPNLRLVAAQCCSHGLYLWCHPASFRKWFGKHKAVDFMRLPSASLPQHIKTAFDTEMSLVALCQMMPSLEDSQRSKLPNHKLDFHICFILYVRDRLQNFSRMCGTNLNMCWYIVLHLPSPELDTEESPRDEAQGSHFVINRTKDHKEIYNIWRCL